MNPSEFTYATNYYQQPLSWIKRLLSAAIAVFMVFWIDLNELEATSDMVWLGYLFAAFVAIYIIVSPFQELAIDDHNFYYIRKSVMPMLSSTKSYGLDQIQAIQARGKFSQQFPAMNVFSAVLSFSRIDLLLKNKQRVGFDLSISKKTTKEFVDRIKKKAQLQ